MAVKHKILTKNGVEEKTLTPIKAIRAKCMECSNWQYGDVARCEILDCAHWVFRFGKNPDRKGIGNTV